MKELSGHDIDRMEAAAGRAGHISIVTHIKPDGDAMGSSIGLWSYLTSRGHDSVSIVLPSAYPANLSFMVQEEVSPHIIIYDEDPAGSVRTLTESDLIFCLDFNAFKRTEHLQYALASSGACKILIDHHLGPDLSLFEVAFSETGISSTSELLYHILMKAEKAGSDASRLPRLCAEALYTGMTTDTNNFANSTFPSTLMMASELIEAGIDRDAIVEKVMHSYRENRLRLLGLVLKDKMTITPEGGAVIVLDKKTMEEYDIAEGDTEGFVNVPLDIADVRLSILVKEDEGKARVSLRSKKGTSANRCAVRYFKGGGHENASGGRIDIPSDIEDISDAPSYVTACIREFLREEKQ